MTFVSKLSGPSASTTIDAVGTRFALESSRESRTPDAYALMTTSPELAVEASPTITAAHQVNADPSDTLRLPKVRQRTGLGRSTIYRLMSQGQFPSAVQLAPRAVGWRKADIDAWLEARPKAAH